ncbi:MAG: gamma-glutamyltransferase [Pseudomonadales bacterium]
MITRRRILIVIFSALLASCTSLTTQQPSTGVAAIAMPDHFSADVAQAVLEDGGNAIDAAVAAAFTLAVTYPEAGNIGGGGFMLIKTQAAAELVDYREVAPAAASRDMYLDAQGEVIENASLIGAKASGVPGTVAGLWAAHQRHGKLPWAELLTPAIALAAEGFVMPAHLADRIAEEAPGYAGVTNFAAYFSEARAGNRFKQPELATTLQRIADHGADGFYRGDTAEMVAAHMANTNGLIDASDLAAYQPVWREPLRVQWRKYEILSAPLPSSGGFAVIQLLKMKDFLDDKFASVAHNSPQYIHLVAEMEKRVFADRAEYLGDPAFVNAPMAKLIDNDYIRSRAAEVNPTTISTLDTVRPGLKEGHSTTHFSIIDKEGNAVSNTYTLNTWFGSGTVVEGAGFLLNNEMDDFSVKPGVTNFYGVVGHSANAIAPNKRMLSSMSPTILLRDGGVEVVVGSPGGSTIFTSVFQSIINVADFGMSAQDAVSASRFHHQLLPPDLVTFSVTRPLPDATVEALSERGYNATPHPWEFGDVQLIWRKREGFDTGADPRGRGVARELTNTSVGKGS